MDPVLKVTDLSKYFSRAGKNGFFAVDHVSFVQGRLTRQPERLKSKGRILPD